MFRKFINRQNFVKWARSDYFKLVPILGLAFYLAFIPHQSFSYPVHLDEWIHLACSNEIIDEASTSGLVNPFTGGDPIRNQLVEVGFHIFWAVFHQISGIDWIIIFKYLPAIIFVFTVLSVFLLARKQGFGWEAALCTCLVPTTVGILGPGFLVPVAMGLFFIALFLFIAFNFRSWWSYAVLFILNFYLLSMHAATWVGLVIILTPYILLNLKDNLKHSLMIASALIIPFLIACCVIPGVWDILVMPSAQSIFTPQTIPQYIEIPEIIPTYGYLPVILCLVGILSLSIKGGRRNYGLALGLLLLLVMLAIYYAFGYGTGMMYYRGLQYAMLMISIVAGAGLMSVKNLKLSKEIIRIKVPAIIRNAGYIAVIVIIGVILCIAIPARQNIPYYHMIDSTDYQAFVWIRDNISSDYEKAILDPWKGSPFTAISGKKVYTWIGERPLPRDNRAYEFLENGCEDTDFLKDNDITIVYSRDNVNNPELIEVKKHIYLLK